MIKFFSIALAFLLPNLLVAQQRPGPQQMEVMMHTASLRTALLQKDSASLARLLADDVTYGHTNGLVQTKAELIRSVVSGEQRYQTIAPAEMRVRLYGNTGIVNMKAKVNMLYQGSPLDLSMAIVLVWVKKEQAWQLVARQSVKQ